MLASAALDEPRSSHVWPCSQRKMASSVEDFNNGASRIVKEHEIQCATIVKEARHKTIAEINTAMPLDSILKAIDNVSNKLKMELPQA